MLHFIEKWDGRGRPSKEYVERRKAFKYELAAHMREIRKSIDFSIGSREWCYLLESHGLTKGDFDRAEAMITECRKEGILPLDICHDDANRATINIQSLDREGIEEYAASALRTAQYVVNSYTPHSFWDDKAFYLELWTEKLSLRNMFEPICETFYVPLANGKGWSDLNMRASAMRRFQKHEQAGRQCVLLYCGDHDPMGIAISDTLHKNFKDLEQAVGWNPDRLIVDRFGLNHDFIVEHGLSWIENLETSSGKEADESHAIVKRYVEKYGRRKVEASSLVARVDQGRKLCRDAILKYVTEDHVAEYEESLVKPRAAVNQALSDLLRAA